MRCSEITKYYKQVEQFNRTNIIFGGIRASVGFGDDGKPKLSFQFALSKYTSCSIGTDNFIEISAPDHRNIAVVKDHFPTVDG